MDWEAEVLGEMEGGYDNDRFSCYWDSDSHMTYPLILAKIPVKNPWEIFAYLPFGNWNECPDTPDLMAVAKYWFEQHGIRNQMCPKLCEDLALGTNGKTLSETQVAIKVPHR